MITAETTMIRVFTAFSGYDSQCMALDRVGIDYDLVGWSEIDRYAVAAHNAVYPQYAGRNFGDISKIDWAQVPDFDLFTYSSPCQDFSTAGRQKGGEKGSGTRSSLLWECERAIAYKRPKYLLFENVSALVSNKFIRLFNDWQLTLERLGYTNFTQVLNAKDYGVPQNRERVFMVSVLNCDKPFYFPETIPLRKCLRDVLEQEVDRKYLIKDTAYEYINKRIGGYCHINGLDGQGKISANITSSYSHNNTGNVIVIAKLKTKAHESTNRIYSKSGISPTLTCCCGGNLQPKILQRNHGFNKGSVKEICNTITKSSFEHNNYLQNGDIVRRLTPKECLRLMDVSEKNIDKLLHCGISNSQLYKLAGNSIVVDVLALIFRQLLIGNTNKNQQTEIF